MTNHPNRSRAKSSASNPTPEEIIQARESAGLNMAQAAAVIYCNRAAWLRWESGERRMHPAMWELFRIKTSSRENHSTTSTFETSSSLSDLA